MELKEVIKRVLEEAAIESAKVEEITNLVEESVNITLERANGKIKGLNDIKIYKECGYLKEFRNIEEFKSGIAVLRTHTYCAEGLKKYREDKKKKEEEEKKEVRIEELLKEIEKEKLEHKTKLEELEARLKFISA